jgi:hypothetical protein
VCVSLPIHHSTAPRRWHLLECAERSVSASLMTILS